MARIEAEAARMGRLVDDLLALARMDRPSGDTREPVDVGRVAAEAVDAARVVDGSRVWDLDVPPAPVAVVVGDPSRLRQVVDNLLANARLHTPSGTSVRTTVAVDGDRVHLEVRDDGPGIRRADRERAFDRFWRATRADENPVEGTGLGLAIVRSIARDHGGDAHLADVPVGTTVLVQLPLARGQR
jgi:two-component system OmpR family sensor kinase